ncbi:hypothetical protein [Micromonospora sp. MA102]|uniref:hypothetical protein n=1 Tax=Micromonospora sp. MA102 TaxID=2952755 RepID=UPI0021C68A91|nr:hypothetical protein [Micromonospora sp. MA102]
MAGRTLVSHRSEPQEKRPIQTFLDAVSGLLHDHGYTLNPNQLPDACAHHLDEVNALLAAPGTITAAGGQIIALTAATGALSDPHTSRSADLSLREWLGHIADTLTTAPRLPRQGHHSSSPRP